MRVVRKVIEHRARKAGILVQRPQTLQYLFNKTAAKQSVALIGNNHRIRPFNAKPGENRAHHATPAHGGVGAAIDRMAHRIVIVLAINNIEMEIRPVRIAGNAGFQTSNRAVEAEDKPFCSATTVFARSVMNIETNRAVKFADIAALGTGCEFRSKYGLVEAVDYRAIRKC